MVILTDSEHTVDATAKTITLASPYDALSLAQILKIYNLTTGSVLYDVDRTDGTISISGAVVTYTYDDASMANGDSVYVEVDAGTTPGGTSSSDAVYTNATRLNPEWAQVLDEVNLNAVTVTNPGTAIDVAAYDFISVYVNATSVTTGGTFTFQSSPQAAATDALWATVASTGSNATSAETQVIGADGMYLFEIDVRKQKNFRTNLTARTDGTFTTTVVG